jgi:hypothetical protein
MKTYILTLSWSVSRGRDTYGYNICRLDDSETGKRYRCNGGGYDMVGTVLAKWIQDRFQDRLRDIKERSASYGYTDSQRGWTRAHNEVPDSLYGMFYNQDTKRISIDGSCGVNSVMNIAEAIGLTIRYMPTVGRSRTSKGFIVTDTRAEASHGN